MTLLTRLPVYASGLALTAALVAVADTRNWSGWTTIAAALGVGGFYVVAILVPWLIREGAVLDRPACAFTRNGNGDQPLIEEMDLFAPISEVRDVMILIDNDLGLMTPPTSGTVALRRERQAVAR